MILYSHGFLDVVLSDNLSRTVHVPLQTSDQLPADYILPEAMSDLTPNIPNLYSLLEINALKVKQSSKCTCRPKLRQSCSECRSP